MKFHFDVIVVGGGHAGTEAACAAARMGLSALLLTHNIETIGQMSCNPAIGGIGKGHLVREIDALGGVMARATDLGGIQFRTLNESKGPAVRATRAQADRALYRQAIRNLVESHPNLSVFQQAVDDLLLEGTKACGVRTQMGMTFYGKAIVLTAGTFLGGKVHMGEQTAVAGRAADPASITLSQKLRELPFRVGRLKTGTPARIDKRTICFSGLAEQAGDNPAPLFSYLSHENDHPPQVSCFVTYTNEKTHEVIRKNLHRSPMYSGAIEGIGPRYCPSIEDKVTRFSERLSHQIFIEPEGLNSIEIYPNGISTSLPFDVQVEFIRTIQGFENAHITRPGYAIEYDFFDPQDLKPSLETKAIQHLFFAGQINGTTGYEEAAAQGLLAGINAGLCVKGLEPWCPLRHQAYMGVLVDDLITNGTKEPYRMFTSRAEHRLLLREDNADLRLTEMGYKLGVVSEAQYAYFCHKQEQIEKTRQLLRDWTIFPNQLQDVELKRDIKAIDLIRRPEVNLFDLVKTNEQFTHIEELVLKQVEIQEKYAGYIDRQSEEIERNQRYLQSEIPDVFDYDRVSGLSNEVREKLKRVRPRTLQDASRISGVTPAALSILIVYLKRFSLKVNAEVLA